MRSWLKKTTARKMTAGEAAWLAGFFDGEGTLCQWLGGRGHKYRCWVLTTVNTHRPSLEKCVSITGVGSVNVKNTATEVRKTCWVWQVSSQRNIAAILEQMLPYLIIKKQKAEDFFRIWKDVK